VSRTGALLLLASLVSPSVASACKLVPEPTSEDLVRHADAVVIVDVVAIEAIVDPTPKQREQGYAVVKATLVESLKGTVPDGPLRLETTPDDCGGFLWPGRWLLFVHAPADGGTFASPGYGSFPLNIEDAAEALEEIKSIISGTNQ